MIIAAKVRSIVRGRGFDGVRAVHYPLARLGGRKALTSWVKRPGGMHLKLALRSFSAGNQQGWQGSPGIMDLYTLPPKRRGWLPAAVMGRVTDKIAQTRGQLKTGVCIGHIQRFVKGFNHKDFPAQATALFVEFLRSHREGDLEALGKLVTQRMLQSLAAELEQCSGPGAGATGRKKGKARGRRKGASRSMAETAAPVLSLAGAPGVNNAGKVRFVYRFLEMLGPTTVTQVRSSYDEANGGWGQVTCILPTSREVLEVDSQAREVRRAGAEPVVLDTLSVVVYEVCFNGERQSKLRAERLMKYTHSLTHSLTHSFIHSQESYLESLAPLSAQTQTELGRLLHYRR
ncbi:unnamed protein product [Chrysoparadoxa australica]